MTELHKQVGWSQVRPVMYHLRTHAGQEVDVVLEDRAGNLVGIEVKASSTVSTGDFRGLCALAQGTGARFRQGIVLYTGVEAVPFGSNLRALPFEALWRPC